MAVYHRVATFSGKPHTGSSQWTLVGCWFSCHITESVHKNVENLKSLAHSYKCNNVLETAGKKRLRRRKYDRPLKKRC